MRKRIYIYICLLFAVLIVIQHQFVVMCFDDYGYASLSYGWTENKAGMSYTVSDIFKFLEWHYKNWGGRIFYFFLEIVIFRIGGMEWIQMIQAVIVIMISMISGKIIAHSLNCDPYVGMAAAFMLYGTFHIQTLRDGVYWYTASVLYVWPLLPLLCSAFLLLRMQSQATVLQECAAASFLFLAAFSQEQSAVAAVVWISCMILFQYLHAKYVPRYMISMAVSAAAGSAVTILAPGNFIRANDERYLDFYSKSFAERIIENTGKIVEINIGSYNWVFVLILTVFCLAAAAMYFRSRTIYIIIILFAGYFFMEQVSPVSIMVQMLVRIVWLICFCAILFVYYYRRSNYLFLALLIAGICSQAMLVISPSISIRSHTMMEFILHIILAECMISVGKISKNKQVYTFLYRVCMILTILYSAWNFSIVIHGYKNNHEISAINHYKLLETGRKIKAGKAEEEVILYKLTDDIFANCMPYQPGFDFIEVWMKKYYELPQDIDFYWQDIDFYMQGLDENLEFYCISGSWYQDHWLGNGAEFLVQAKENMILTISVTNSDAIENQKLRCSLDGEEDIYEFSPGEEKLIDLYIPAGKNILTMSPSETFIPNNGDLRELSVMFHINNSRISLNSTDNSIMTGEES